METLNINEKINVRSNLKYTERRILSSLARSYSLATGYKNNIKSDYANCLYYSVMPCNTQNHLLINSNFQRSFR